jgi:hypothetical protein
MAGRQRRHDGHDCTERLGVSHTLAAIPEKGGPTACGVPDVDHRSDVAGEEADRPRRVGPVLPSHAASTKSTSEVVDRSLDTTRIGTRIAHRSGTATV